MKCQVCKKEIEEGNEEKIHMIVFSYKTFYFCSEEHAKEYAMGD